MASYKLIGQRFVRKYTEPKSSPTYNAALQAQAIVDSLCEVPWEKVRASNASMAYHTDEDVGIGDEKISGFDMNVRIRDEFDAALFCAGHSGGQHRAYANAAVYHYVLPDGTLPKLTKLTAKVTSDPYNSAGARIAILTNATGEIPTNCNVCRTGDAHAEGVAPRTVASNGNWFPTMADCVFSASAAENEVALPTGGLQLEKHLFLFVLMESYSTVRGNWLEGCSYIKNLVEIETNASVTGWTDGETYSFIEDEELKNHLVSYTQDNGFSSILNLGDSYKDVDVVFLGQDGMVPKMFYSVVGGKDRSIGEIEGFALYEKSIGLVDLNAAWNNMTTNARKKFVSFFSRGIVSAKFARSFVVGSDIMMAIDIATNASMIGTIQSGNSVVLKYNISQGSFSFEHFYADYGPRLVDLGPDGKNLCGGLFLLSNGDLLLDGYRAFINESGVSDARYLSVEGGKVFGAKKIMSPDCNVSSTETYGGRTCYIVYGSFNSIGGVRTGGVAIVTVDYKYFDLDDVFASVVITPAVTENFGFDNCEGLSVVPIRVSSYIEGYVSACVSDLSLDAFFAIGNFESAGGKSCDGACVIIKRSHDDETFFYVVPMRKNGLVDLFPFYHVRKSDYQPSGRRIMIDSSVGEALCVGEIFGIM